MKKRNEHMIFIIALSATLAGCSTMLPTPIPFVDSGPLNSSDRSKITIRSATAGVSFNPLEQDNKPETEGAEGKVSLNSEPQGEFTGKIPVFSKEVPPGPYLVSVCPNYRCVQKQITLKPNTHAIFKYKYNLKYQVIRQVAEWTLELEKVEDYPFTGASTPQNSTKKNEYDKKRTFDDMQHAEKKCESLGLKRQTEEFGKCVLSVSD
jgi:hypothetical protein